MQNGDDAVVSKGEFAKLINVTPGRVSQMISEGKIGPDALEGQGRNAKIRVGLARRQIGVRTDPGQRLGNGLKTDLSPAGDDDEPLPRLSSESDNLDLQIKRERLEREKRANRKDREEELARQGRYLNAVTARAEMARLAGGMMKVFEGAIPDLAAALAAEFEVPQRDVTHLLRREFRKVREKAADTARRNSTEVVELVADTDLVEDDGHA